MLQTRFAVAFSSIFLVVCGANVALGQEYPNKPIRMVTSAIGGGNDFAARIVAQGLSEVFGQQVIVDNRPSIFHGVYLPSAPADGYNLLLGGESLWMVPLLQKVPYETMRDIYPVTLIAIASNVLMVHPTVPAKSVKELIDLAKAKPGELNLGSGSTGGSAHLAGKLFESMANVRFVQINHSGTGPLVTSLVGGQGVHLGFIGISQAAPHIKAGRLRGLAVTTLKPSAAFPGLPTVAETVPGYDAGGQVGLFAPPKTPDAIVNRLNREVTRIVHSPATKERFTNAGVDVATSTPGEFREFMRAEIAKWGKLIKDANIRVE
jgi:tripartite-type tricarboxylate transporter receptor subunit TctC